MYHLVYLTRNLINNKIYVGAHSTNNLEDGYLGSGQNLKRAIKKYGKENFERIILHYCYNKEQTYEVEAQIIDISFVIRKDTYNLCVGGCGGDVHTNETKLKMSNIKKGKSLPLTTRIKMSKSGKGRIFSKEHKIKISIGQKGHANFEGKFHTEDTKRKMSESAKGKFKSEDTKKKMSESHKGRTAWNKGIPCSEETKNKISKSKIKMH